MYLKRRAVKSSVLHGSEGMKGQRNNCVRVSYRWGLNNLLSDKFHFFPSTITQNWISKIGSLSEWVKDNKKGPQLYERIRSLLTWLFFKKYNTTMSTLAELSHVQDWHRGKLGSLKKNMNIFIWVIPSLHMVSILGTFKHTSLRFGAWYLPTLLRFVLSLKKKFPSLLFLHYYHGNQRKKCEKNRSWRIKSHQRLNKFFLSFLMMNNLTHFFFFFLYRRSFTSPAESITT